MRRRLAAAPKKREDTYDDVVYFSTVTLTCSPLPDARMILIMTSTALSSASQTSILEVYVRRSKISFELECTNADRFDFHRSTMFGRCVGPVTGMRSASAQCRAMALY